MGDRICKVRAAGLVRGRDLERGRRESWKLRDERRPLIADR
jgi:hypothetical protein